jgi:chitinase
VTPTSTPSKPSSSSLPAGYTTSTVYATTTYTITSCAPTVTKCPYGSVTTTVVPVSTTICPISDNDEWETKTSTVDQTTTKYVPVPPVSSVHPPYPSKSHGVVPPVCPGSPSCPGYNGTTTIKPVPPVDGTGVVVVPKPSTTLVTVNGGAKVGGSFFAIAAGALLALAL